MAGETVQITADGLVDLRLNSELAKRLHLDCGYDHLFWTEAGQALARLAEQLDSVFEPYNVARYKWFTERLHAAAERFAQILILGAGYDTRSLSLTKPGVASPSIFEVDFPEKLTQKRAVLAANGVEIPANVQMVGADLAAGGLAGLLDAAGYRSDIPTAVIQEGVVFFLPQAAAAAVIDPGILRLASGSSLALDFWTPARQQTLNAKIRARTGRDLFGATPLGAAPAEAVAFCRGLGYVDCRVTGLWQICAGYGLEEIADPLGDSWFILEATWP